MEISQRAEIMKFKRYGFYKILSFIAVAIGQAILFLGGFLGVIFESQIILGGSLISGCIIIWLSLHSFTKYEIKQREIIWRYQANNK